MSRTNIQIRRPVQSIFLLPSEEITVLAHMNWTKCMNIQVHAHNSAEAALDILSEHLGGGQ